MTDRVDYDVALEVASHEAMIRQAYRDSVGKWTWSVGLTSATGHNVERYIGKPQPLAHCLAVYVWALKNYADQVEKAFAGTKLTKAQFAAAVSFHWNTGAIGRASWVKSFKAGNVSTAKVQFMNWVSPPEIKGRREKERDLFFSGKWSNKGTMTEFTRVTSRSTPDWGSAKRINVEKELRAAFAADATPTIDTPPMPDAAVEEPTLSPVPLPSPEPEWHPADPVWPPPDYEREPPKEPEMAQKTGIGSIVGLIIIVGLVGLFIYAKFIAGWF